MKKDNFDLLNSQRVLVRSRVKEKSLSELKEGKL